MKFIQAAENNKTEILRFFKKIAKSGDVVLEIGSGTGQHIVYFASKMKDIVWQPSEKADNITSVEQRVNKANLVNLNKPWVVDVGCPPNSTELFNLVYASNVLQCISLNELGYFMLTARKFLENRGILVVYGPFLREGRYASVGDSLLDNHLKTGNAKIGIKNLRFVKETAISHGFESLETVSMEKNNLILLFTAV